jgi:hypothetical protein
MAANRLSTAARLGTNTTITMSGVSQATGTFSAQCYMVRVATGAQPGFIKIGNSPTAAATDPLIGANVVDYFSVTPGMSAAVLQAGTAGSISFTEMS